jgi:hypothetical protein
VTLQPDGVGGRRVLEVFPIRLIAIRNRNIGAFVEKGGAGRTAQAAGAASNQNDAALEPRAHMHTSRLIA